MKVKCIIKNYTQERTFSGRNGESVVRDIALTEVSSNPLVEEKYPNEFQTAYFAHIDDDVLNRAVMNKTPFTFDLSFSIHTTDKGWQNQKVTIRQIEQ